MVKPAWKSAMKYSGALAFACMGVILMHIIRADERDGGGMNVPVRVVSLSSRQDDMMRSPERAGVPDGVLYTRWKTFTTHDGLPADKVFCVKVDGRRIWAGTLNGLACYEGGQWHSYGTRAGLPYPAVVLSLDVSPITGDLWIGTMGGLARYSGGRFDVFTQINSGLSNDFVYAVQCDPDEDYVWAATAMGASRLNLRTGEWTIFTEKNTPMREPWPYSVAIERGIVYIGVWGGGILEYTSEKKRWREYRDPDGETEVDMFPDDGPVHDMTASVACSNGILWQATYFGAARYEGRRWRTYDAEDSGLASNFIQFMRARDRTAWMCTDNGLSVTDGDNWVTYRRLNDGRGEILVYEEQHLTARRITPTSLAHNFVLGIDFQGEVLWVSTAKGVSRGTPEQMVGGRNGRKKR